MVSFCITGGRLKHFKLYVGKNKKILEFVNKKRFRLLGSLK